MSFDPVLRAALAATILAGSACGGGEPRPSTETASTPAVATAATDPASDMSVAILEPAAAATVTGDTVRVLLSASGVSIVPAGDTTSGTGHHHLYLDEDLGEPGTMVPTVDGRIVHLGTGASEYVFTDVPAGEHRLIAVVADGMHVPLQPWVTDTIAFTVH